MLAGAYSEQKHKWKKTTTTATLEKKIKLDAVREHQRVHNHREFIVTFRFGSAFKRRVLIERERGMSEQKIMWFGLWTSSQSSGRCDEYVIEFQFEI